MQLTYRRECTGAVQNAQSIAACWLVVSSSASDSHHFYCTQTTQQTSFSADMTIASGNKSTKHRPINHRSSWVNLIIFYS